MFEVDEAHQKAWQDLDNQLSNFRSKDSLFAVCTAMISDSNKEAQIVVGDAHDGSLPRYVEDLGILFLPDDRLEEPLEIYLQFATHDPEDFEARELQQFADYFADLNMSR